MDVAVPLWLLITLATSICSLAAYALGRWSTGSASTRRTKQPTSPQPSPTSSVHSELASLQADQAALYSTLEKLTTTVKRLSSRAGMRDSRERTAEPPPLGTPKAQLREFYGLAGKSPREFAQVQLDLERGRTN